MTYGWNDHPTKAEVKYSVGSTEGGPVSTVYRIGKYDVTVPGSTLDVTYRNIERADDQNPKRAFPNMNVSDGELRIPITDFVDTILTRLEPRDLAVALWQNNEVREEFMGCLTSRWSEMGITDADRRTFLREVKEEVHSKALDHLASKMAHLEYSMSRRSFFYHEVNAVNARLREAGCKDYKGELIQLPHSDSDPDFRIGGKHWNEARDWWRAEALKQFPVPETEGAR